MKHLLRSCWIRPQGQLAPAPFKFHAILLGLTLGQLFPVAPVVQLPSPRPVAPSIPVVPSISVAPSIPVAQAASFQAQATATARMQQRQQQAQQVRPDNYDLKQFPVTDKNERRWRNILWTTAVVQPQEPYVAEAVSGILALATRPKLSRGQIRTVDMAMQVGTQLYLSNPTLYGVVGQRFVQIVERSPDPLWVSMALSGLGKPAAGPKAMGQLQQLGDRVKARFPNWSKHMALRTTLTDLALDISPAPVPPLRDLLAWNVAPKQPHLYVICQPDRTVLCRTVLKDRNGQFVRQPQGPLWSVPLLLRSIHGLSWNFTRGETPQGIYRIEGTVPQPDDQFFRAFGQFDLVNLFVPFEPGVKAFLPSRKGTFKGSLDAYRALLPPSWRNYVPLQQTYWAGKLGRSLFRIHGSGEGVDFFSGKPQTASYPWNPTIGCLSALEIYDEAGRLQQADMPEILNVLTRVGGKNFTGYLIVVDLPSQAPVPIDLQAIEAAIPQ